MPPLRNLEGQRFGKLLVIGRGRRKGYGASWLCRCDCGKERDVTARHLLQGCTKSCGCLNNYKPPKR